MVYMQISKGTMQSSFLLTPNLMHNKKTLRSRYLDAKQKNKNLTFFNQGSLEPPGDAQTF